MSKTNTINEAMKRHKKDEINHGKNQIKRKTNKDDEKSQNNRPLNRVFG